MKFKGTKNYVSTDDLSMAVNASVTLERPLIIKEFELKGRKKDGRICKKGYLF